MEVVLESLEDLVRAFRDHITVFFLAFIDFLAMWMVDGFCEGSLEGGRLEFVQLLGF